ncbi:hypothetical protein N1031_07745 [Herbiconiux moechotypicola]|uniref:DUF4190 domain-containing protein n=1 Tax=Herbiconiux moechotypicola TaxID=637393 RepID=A0ABN3DHM9_9MICO|nr:hypothetical protein [Herbiconiux moechotypicola]MCS5729651.1 hypothetical protein [Herbiconiux moechotypicola]
MSASELTRPAAGTDYPGKTLGIVGLVVAILAPLIGLIISAVAYTQSKRVGVKNSLAFIGIIVGAALTVLGFIVSIFSIIAAASGAAMY